ncbi:MAG: hypothetical protein KJ915_02745 [Candidatus Omnitrophica bacterium]|nr:hypothetical protein [Candidatus Omnitrophota bacterium]
MFKRGLIVLSLIAVIGFYGINLATAQDDSMGMKDVEMGITDAEMGIKGVVTSVAEDMSSLMINDQTIMIDPELKDYMNIEAGDSVELIVNTVDGKKVVVDFDYIDLE